MKSSKSALEKSLTATKQLERFAEFAVARFRSLGLKATIQTTEIRSYTPSGNIFHLEYRIKLEHNLVLLIVRDVFNEQLSITIGAVTGESMLSFYTFRGALSTGYALIKKAVSNFSPTRGNYECFIDREAVFNHPIAAFAATAFLRTMKRAWYTAFYCTGDDQSPHFIIQQPHQNFSLSFYPDKLIITEVIDSKSATKAYDLADPATDVEKIIRDCVKKIKENRDWYG